MGESVGMPKRPRRNEQSSGVSYGGWQPAIGASGDGRSHVTWVFGSVYAWRPNRGYVPCLGSGHFGPVVSVCSGNQCGFQYELVPGLYQLSAVLFLLAVLEYPHSNNWPGNTRGGLTSNHLQILPYILTFPFQLLLGSHIGPHISPIASNPCGSKHLPILSQCSRAAHLGVPCLIQSGLHDRLRGLWCMSVIWAHLMCNPNPFHVCAP